MVMWGVGEDDTKGKASLITTDIHIYVKIRTYRIYTLYITVHEISPFPTITTKRPTFRYRLLYQRGQLSVGERLYQSVMPGFQPPRADAWVANQAVLGVKGTGNMGNMMISRKSFYFQE